MSLSAYFRSAARPAPESAFARYSDLMLVAGVIAIVALMVLPMPALAIDALVAVNILVGVTLLLVAIYIAAPLEFSVFPSLLLITTLFRLSLSIATTRMILLEGHAGHIIDTFGKVVAGGNLVVGLVVFLIITVVQFIVIAKGAERAAEVAARFSLDAMPGKQLSIDSDLRSGLIDKDEARRKRRELEQESKLHGSLDGAMKFVKGDAIAGIVIILINLLGGLAVGVMQQGMAMSDAMVKYSLLTIGDGLVTQIPALLAAMSAGLIVTRSADDEHDKHLGDAIRRQLTAKPRVLLVAGGICVLMALVPGFPALVFLALGAVVGSAGALLTPALRHRFDRVSRPALEAVTKRREHAPQVLATSVPQMQPSVPLLLELPEGALDAASARVLVHALEGVLEQFHLHLGLPLPRITLHLVGDRQAQAWRLLAFEVPITSGRIEGDAALAAIPVAVEQALRRHAALFLGIQETSALLTRAGGDYPDVVKETLRAIPMQRLAEILRRLVEEEVPIRNLRDILEALAEAGQREKDVFTLTEFARMALKRSISHRRAPQGTMRALLLQPGLEDQLRQAVRVTGGVHQLALNPAVAQRIVRRIEQAVQARKPDAIVTTVDVRRHLRKLIEPECFDMPVLSYHELMPHVKLDVLDRLELPPPSATLLEAA
ncbi:flagellar biosynthesis protein FlhA [Schlegelella sp. S2-27]|uniref:Flagellar biosynthesis protein FlhA n=1 Tax=Caldimonas mangrovi TaxID=2944811 RepID=A0ABT0YIK3_9BURK|nr:flagellar biosynthesis protein FlhA [Caldimonas mangrovi]MCM5678254.1 flagellar biosynthesis protein FlhA [Caldimonas mangrovi]